MNLKFFISFIFSLIFITLNHSIAQNVYDNRDSVLSHLKDNYFSIEQNERSDSINYIIASRYLRNNYSSPKIYLTFYFSEDDICIKTIRFIPNSNFDNDLSFYRTLPRSRIADSSNRGIKYAWFLDDSKSVVAYFDPESTAYLGSHYAITFEPFNPTP